MSDERSPIIETHRLSDADAADLERQAGCLVVEIYGGCPMRHNLIQMATYGEACNRIADLAGRHPDRTFVVYRPSRTMHGVTRAYEADPAPQAPEEAIV